MTEETFNCLACGIKIGSAGYHNKTCVLKCFDVYTDETLENIYKFIDRLKQKSYSEGYEKGREDERKEAEKDLAFCRREHPEAIKFYEEKLKELEKNG